MTEWQTYDALGVCICMHLVVPIYDIFIMKCMYAYGIYGHTDDIIIIIFQLQYIL